MKTIGFTHEYRPLAHEELHFVPDRRWHKLGQTLDQEDFTDAQAAAGAGIIRGNLRLIDRFFAQVERVMKISERTTITDDVMEAARSPSSSVSAKTDNRTVKKPPFRKTVTALRRQSRNH